MWRKHQDLLGAWRKITHHCVSEAGPADLVESLYDTGTSTFTVKGKKNRILR
jgi:hypothetical protein